MPPQRHDLLCFPTGCVVRYPSGPEPSFHIPSSPTCSAASALATTMGLASLSISCGPQGGGVCSIVGTYGHV